jgi:hypothetical protein
MVQDIQKENRLDLVLQKQKEYVYSQGGLLRIQEGDAAFNDLNREIIDAFKETHGKAYLGEVNFDGDKRKEIIEGKRSIYEEYTGQMVNNFGCAFVVPEKDEKLEMLIRDWNTPSASHTLQTVDVVLTRIKKIGGLLLIWF